jgi:hypothetical protein
VTKQRKQIEPPQSAFDPEMRSWIDNVIVPAMVRDYIAEHVDPNGVAARSKAVPESEANHTPSAEAIR